MIPNIIPHTHTLQYLDNFPDYELIDCGGKEKLERFGKYILIRPEPQALWDKSYSDNEWNRLAHAKFHQQTSNSGEWVFIKNMPKEWEIEYRSNAIQIQFKLKFTSFKHVGIFPEQAIHWEYIHQFISQNKKNNPIKALNLFAYTGGASLVAKHAGADVTHLDSVKQVVTWANQNMEISGLKDIRWLVEDALKFVQREEKRGNKYQCIILDPPSFGLGPKGERWQLEDSINELMKSVLNILDNRTHCLVMNTYSLNLSSTLLTNFLVSNKINTNQIEIGELINPSKSGYLLPLGSYLRFQS